MFRVQGCEIFVVLESGPQNEITEVFLFLFAPMNIFQAVGVSVSQHVRHLNSLGMWV